MSRIEKVLTALILLGSSIVGCQAPQPIGPGNIYEPDEREARLWTSSRAEADAITNSGHAYNDPTLRAYVQSVLEKVMGNNLAAYLPLNPEIIIVDHPVPNALSLPHGAVVLHTGILSRMRSEAQLAMLLGHEITHATHRHMDRHAEDTYARTGAHSYVALISVAGGQNIHDIVAGMSQLITVAAVYGYKRDLEREADRVGLTLVAQAGYDPAEAQEMFEQALGASDRKGRRQNYLYATHPKMKDRVRSCQQLRKKMPPELVEQAHDVGIDRYLAHTTELIYAEAQRHISQGKFDLAEETLAFMQEHRPTDAEPYAIQGDLFRAKGTEQFGDKAEDAYLTALTVNRRSAMAHKGLGLLYVHKKKPELAIMHLHNYIRLAPNAVDRPYIQQYITQLTE